MNTTFQVFDPNITAPSGSMTLGMQLQLNQDKVVYHNPSEGVAHEVDDLDALYATCQIEYLTGELSYDPGSDRYILLQTSSVSPQLASALWGPLLSQYGTNRLIADILGPIMADPFVDPSSFISANLARIALGLLGGIMQPKDATSAITARQGVLGLYPVAPVFCVAGILYVYAFFALFILFALVSSTSYTVTATPTDWGAKEEDPSPIKKESALAIGQLWLTNLLPLIGSIFAGGDGRDPQRSIADKSLNMVFDQEGNVDYLAIGRTKIGKDTKFGIRPRKERTAHDSAETL
ncbi:hypothetical protein FRC05_003691 [Tulasnella sp. 425]|nr:hypothetical protein FRC05_003691 [Tulasnella sp. 425]